MMKRREASAKNDATKDKDDFGNWSWLLITNGKQKKPYTHQLEGLHVDILQYLHSVHVGRQVILESDYDS